MPITIETLEKIVMKHEHEHEHKDILSELQSQPRLSKRECIENWLMIIAIVLLIYSIYLMLNIIVPVTIK